LGVSGCGFGSPFSEQKGFRVLVQAILVFKLFIWVPIFRVKWVLDFGFIDFGFELFHRG
jgi:hypothetical protein